MFSIALVNTNDDAASESSVTDTVKQTLSSLGMDTNMGLQKEAQ